MTTQRILEDDSFSIRGGQGGAWDLLRNMWASLHLP